MYFSYSLLNDFNLLLPSRRGKIDSPKELRHANLEAHKGTYKVLQVYVRMEYVFMKLRQHDVELRSSWKNLNISVENYRASKSYLKDQIMLTNEKVDTSP